MLVSRRKFVVGSAASFAAPTCQPAHLRRRLPNRSQFHPLQTHLRAWRGWVRFGLRPISWTALRLQPGGSANPIWVQHCGSFAAALRASKWQSTSHFRSRAIGKGCTCRRPWTAVHSSKSRRRKAGVLSCPSTNLLPRSVTTLMFTG